MTDMTSFMDVKDAEPERFKFDTAIKVDAKYLVFYQQ